MEPTLIREELVELSVLRWITGALPDYGYVLAEDAAHGNVHVREAFPTAHERNEELAITTLAFGFNIDDGGEAAEMGSNLTRYVHTIVCWVFSLEPRFGRRLGHTLKHVARRNNDIIPLLDFNQPDPPPVIDGMNVMKAQTRHEVNQSPRPWDRYVWTCAISVQDIAYPT